MKKKVKVVMLPTEGYPAIAQSIKAKAFNLPKEELYGWIDCPIRTGHTLHHLYLVSDEEIKEDDWCIDSQYNKLFKAGTTPSEKYDFIKKVIATTDKSLKKTSFRVFKDLPSHSLPQIPESFIKAYVEANGEIDEVMVEYEYKCTMNPKACEWSDCRVSNKCGNYKEITYPTLKTRDDNTVIIHKVKNDKQFTLEDIIDILHKFAPSIRPSSSEKDTKGREFYDKWAKQLSYDEYINKWIEENLK
jgi:hypothetical protein